LSIGSGEKGAHVDLAFDSCILIKKTGCKGYAQMKNDSIEAIFFDLGGVVVDFNHYQIAEKLLLKADKQDGLEPREIFMWLFHPDNGLCCAFDTGKISPEDLYSSICKKFGLSLSFKSFARTWSEIFTGNREIIQVINALAGHFRLFLISNTDPLHFQYILKTFPVIRLFEAWTLSYEVGLRKPDEKIYRAALLRSGVVPSRSVFIDDNRENVEAAEKVGMKGVHYKTANLLLRYCLKY
jgi:FMN phosphatase YigB (HAD superfamily)